MKAFARAIILLSVFYFAYVLMAEKTIPIPDSPFSRLFIFPLLGLFLWKGRCSLKGLNGLFGPKGKKIFIAFIVLLGLFRFCQLISHLDMPDKRIEDIAVAYKNSVDVLFGEGKNPYSEVVDEYGVRDKNYSGLKYFPLQLLTYAPFLKTAGLKGIRVANGIIYFILWYVIFLYLKEKSIMHGLLAVSYTHLTLPTILLV